MGGSGGCGSPPGGPRGSPGVRQPPPGQESAGNCFQIASGVQNLNCAAPNTTSNSTPAGLVQGGRRYFAR
eukprot:13727941-Alexandrium_andersonii.AAC.1